MRARPVFDRSGLGPRRGATSAVRSQPNERRSSVRTRFRVQTMLTIGGRLYAKARSKSAIRSASSSRHADQAFGNAHRRARLRAGFPEDGRRDRMIKVRVSPRPVVIIGRVRRSSILNPKYNTVKIRHTQRDLMDYTAHGWSGTATLLVRALRSSRRTHPPGAVGTQV